MNVPNDTPHTPHTNWPSIAVVGLGFIGLPLAMTYARCGCHVTGIDVREAHVQQLLQGITDSIEAYEGHSLQYYLQKSLTENLFTATTRYADAATTVNAYIVTVGIPIIDGTPVYRDIDAATRDLAAVVKPGDLVLYRSTHIPGTLRTRLIPMFEEISPFAIGDQVHIAYAPERVAEGRAMEEFQTVDIPVGGMNEASTAHAIEVLRVINRATLHPTTIDLAETVKVVENVQRDVNIAMAQEIASVAQALGIRTSELIRLANTHPRVNLLTPGAGVGGYCIPNAFYYLKECADAVQQPLPILATARQTNDAVPARMLQRIADTLQFDAAVWTGRRVAVLGLAMKHFSNDDRISPSVALIEVLQARGAAVSAYDPLVQLSRYAYAADSLAACVAEADVVIVTVRQEPWNGLALTALIAMAPHCHLVFDACEAIVGSDATTVPLLRI